MDDLDRAIFLDRLGLSTEALGPPEEWAPIPREQHQRLHNCFWKAVADIIPDDQDDEPYWMTAEASAELKTNN